MVEFRPLPVIDSMASLAIQRKLGGDMAGCVGVLIVRQMTTHAGGAQAVEDACGRAFVAGIARNGGMGAQQWKPVEVVAHVRHRDLPAADRMAILAGRAHLAGVDIGVAIRAHFPHFGKHGIGVALAALYVLVHAAQRELRLRVVIELGHGAQRLPTQCGVAAFARDLQRPMGIFAALRAHHRGAPKEHNG